MRRSCVFLRLRRNILVMAVLSGLCATVTHAQVKAVLYPYIPDAAHDGFTALKEELQVKFKESTGGDFTADITIDPKLNLYDLDTLKYLFECQKADVVEIDTLLLGALENTGLVAPVENMDFMKEISILKEAQQAATVNIPRQSRGL